VQTEELRQQLLPSPSNLFDEFHSFLPSLFAQRVFEIKTWLIESLNMLKSNVLNIDAFVRRSESMRRIQLRYRQKKKSLQTISVILTVVQDAFGFQISPEDKLALAESLSL